MKKRRILLWILGAIITLAMAYYQRLTGPTYPVKIEFSLNNKTYESKLIRSHGGDDDAKVFLNITDENIKAKLFYKNYPENEEDQFNIVDFEKGIKKDKLLFWDTFSSVSSLLLQKNSTRLMFELKSNS